MKKYTIAFAFLTILTLSHVTSFYGKPTTSCNNPKPIITVDIVG
ncbi:MAG: hypothetical protein WBQ73_02910 [Candidatus Babeliales bacterium]